MQRWCDLCHRFMSCRWTRERKSHTRKVIWFVGVFLLRRGRVAEMGSKREEKLISCLVSSHLFAFNSSSPPVLPAIKNLNDRPGGGKERKFRRRKNGNNLTWERILGKQWKGKEKKLTLVRNLADVLTKKETWMAKQWSSDETTARKMVKKRCSKIN